MARILGASLLAAVLVAGCGAFASQSPGPSIAGPTISAGPTTPATVGPSAGEPTGGTGIATCPLGPLTVAEFLAADPRCYSAADVSVVGWWDALRQTDAYANSLNPPGRVLRGAIPIGPWLSERPDEFVLVDAEALPTIPTGGWAESMHWATVTGRRSADNDRACYRDPPADVRADLKCPSHLVASRVVESEAPASALAGCSSPSLVDEGWGIAVENFTAFPPACFDSRDVRLRGWFDIRFLITGWEQSWGISPGWLWVPIGPWTVLAPDSSPPNGSTTLVVYTDPARKLDVSRTNRWVELTGHYADPKAATCHVEYAGGYDPSRDGERIPDSYARRLCEGRFVVSSIKDTAP